MKELKAVHAFDVYEAYTKTGDDDAAQVKPKTIKFSPFSGFFLFIEFYIFFIKIILTSYK